MSGNVFNLTSGAPSASKIEIFAFLVLEEFLMKKDMPETLRQFRQEWNRPNEVPNIKCIE